MPPAPIKKYVAVTGTRTDARMKEVQTDTTAEPSGIEPEPVESHRELTDEWPDRSQLLKYRQCEISSHIVKQHVKRRQKLLHNLRERGLNGLALQQSPQSSMCKASSLRMTRQEDQSWMTFGDAWRKSQRRSLRYGSGLRNSQVPLCLTQCLLRLHHKRNYCIYT